MSDCTVNGVSVGYDEALLSYSTSCNTKASSSHLLFSIAKAASVKDSQKTPTLTANRDYTVKNLIFRKTVNDRQLKC